MATTWSFWTTCPKRPVGSCWGKWAQDVSQYGLADRSLKIEWRIFHGRICFKILKETIHKNERKNKLTTRVRGLHSALQQTEDKIIGELHHPSVSLSYNSTHGKYRHPSRVLSIPAVGSEGIQNWRQPTSSSGWSFCSEYWSPMSLTQESCVFCRHPGHNSG